MSRKQSERLTPKDILLSNEKASFFDNLYRRQLSWTKSTRNYLYRRINLLKAEKILEVGSGTGALLQELNDLLNKADILGIDFNPIALGYCRKHGHSSLVQGDGNKLPIQNDVFDVTLCNYLLLWLDNPVQLIKEFYRVTKPGGWIACLAEPDYSGRIDHPYGEEWKELLCSSLSASDPNVGRKLPQLFSLAGLQATVGLQSVVQISDIVKEMYNDEINSLNSFLPGKLRSKLKDLQQSISLTKPSEMMSFMPVFYAYARKPS